MRIALDGTPLLGPRGGIGWYTWELIRAVSPLVDEINVWPISWRTASDANAPDLPNVRVVRRVAPARPLWESWRRVPFPPLEWFVRGDVFHGTNFLAPRSWHTPVVVTVHDLSFVRLPETCLPATRRFAQLLPEVLRRAAAIIAVSRFTADEIAEWLPAVESKVRVVHNGPHERGEPSTTGIADGPPFVLMLGSLDPRKNIPLALDALRVLRARGVEMRLVLAGGPSPLLDMDALLRERGLTADAVVRTGYVDDARAAALLSEARVLAFPSTYEGFGMPLVEAMGAGLPVVAVRAGPTPEIVQDAAVLTENDVEEFAQGLELAATDDPLRAALVGAGHRRASEFSWTRTGRETFDVYRAV